MLPGSRHRTAAGIKSKKGENWKKPFLQHCLKSCIRLFGTHLVLNMQLYGC